MLGVFFPACAGKVTLALLYSRIPIISNLCTHSHMITASSCLSHRPSLAKFLTLKKFLMINYLLLYKFKKCFFAYFNNSVFISESSLFIHKLDRFSRNRYDSAHYKKKLKKAGVSVLSVLENLDDSPESIILESVLEGMSEYYSKNLAREVMKGMRESALQ